MVNTELLFFERYKEFLNRPTVSYIKALNLNHRLLRTDTSRHENILKNIMFLYFFFFKRGYIGIPNCSKVSRIQLQNPISMLKDDSRK